MSSLFNPIFILPWIIAIVAGIDPPERTASIEARATSIFFGYGRPWLIKVLSRETTGLFANIFV